MSGVQRAGETSNEPPGPLRGVTIAHVGHFDPEYARNRIMAKALRRAGANVLTVEDSRTYLHRSPRLLRGARRADPDVMLVGFPGHADVPTARLAALARRVPVIFDAFVSLYETEVEDRRLTRAGSLRAWRCALEDRIACRFATRVILDTDAHASYFAARVGVPRSKLRRIWVGADDDVMRPGPPPDDSQFKLFVYGSFVPLQGFEHIVRAAKELEQRGEQVTVEIVGSGQTEDAVRRLAGDLGTSNVQFLGRRPYAELPALMAASHVCLGIFGTSGKAQRVIPNKVFDALAVGRAVITADSAAAREALTHGRDAWLCPAGDPGALADAIVALRSDDETRTRIAHAGHELFRERFSIDALSSDVATLVLETLGRTDL